jgi:hypothetical protein
VVSTGVAVEAGAAVVPVRAAGDGAGEVPLRILAGDPGGCETTGDGGTLRTVVREAGGDGVGCALVEDRLHAASGMQNSAIHRETLGSSTSLRFSP